MPTYNKSNVAHAKQLRNSMTPWERKLWYEFLRSRPEHFRRQKPIGEYITDFSSDRAKLVIELDGSGHYTAEQKRYDAIRTQTLNAAGYTVLRFANNDVDRNFSGVCEVIERAIFERIGR
ncbi:endonuclease domain-containing protein [Bifidobacterium callimiconis]|uniref:endonuclease domain-containing protein n=1 Tax=Bifidobacterium callimiconis TaxID=2306973 RepID=UPI001BDD788F|nr:endonuclease domain-containing protein [Bifidobacterium callimiconis]MBT1176090.1 endonuclease domain-containing protein [Bifidobacterium callimiconis]